MSAKNEDCEAEPQDCDLTLVYLLSLPGTDVKTELGVRRFTDR